jgi:hypothetical protein
MFKRRESNDTAIGSLKWTVSLFERREEPAEGGGTVDVLIPLGETHADIQQLQPITSYGGMQIDTPQPTHVIRLRWLDYVEMTNIIMRSTESPIDGTTRTETFRVRRVLEVGGRKRFARIECELERVE